MQDRQMAEKAAIKIIELVDKGYKIACINLPGTLLSVKEKEAYFEIQDMQRSRFELAVKGKGSHFDTLVEGILNLMHAREIDYELEIERQRQYFLVNYHQMPAEDCVDYAVLLAKYSDCPKYLKELPLATALAANLYGFNAEDAALLAMDCAYDCEDIHDAVAEELDGIIARRSMEIDYE